ncbi:MAG: KH domain-containing protein [Anaerolineales bacterium]|nr:MAG: KH domain-containing protein [Anaerolineales bacterium]
MQDLIEYIARSLVDDPTQVMVSERRHGSTTNVLLHVAKEDMGRVIGRNGRVANAMRLLLRVTAARSDRRSKLEIVEPE